MFNDKLNFFVTCRYGHVCAVVGSNVYLFGGSSTNNDVTSYNNDLYVLDREYVCSLLNHNFSLEGH